MNKIKVIDPVSEERFKMIIEVAYLIDSCIVNLNNWKLIDEEIKDLEVKLDLIKSKLVG